MISQTTISIMSGDVKMSNPQTVQLQSSTIQDKLERKITKDVDIMVSSATSSLASPGDSGVQMLDSESEVTSIMSISGYDTFSDGNDKAEHKKRIPQGRSLSSSDTNSDLDSPFDNNRCSIVLNTNFKYETQIDEANSAENITEKKTFSSANMFLNTTPLVMTTSDIANQNTTPPFYDLKIYSQSAPVDCLNMTKSDILISPKKIKEIVDASKIVDVDKTSEIDVVFDSLKIEDLKVEENEQAVSEDINTTEDQMQTSIIAPMPDEQIVFRRQRRKKSKSQDAPKKRVSFHEDILNSTKIDDIHIERGFITHQPEISMSFFGEDSIRRKGVIKGRYSWAAEGDSPYFQNSIPERAIKSEMYVKNYFCYNSSSSSVSLDSTNSSNSSDNSPHEEYAISVASGLQNIKKVPKSSCLKKPKHGHKYIDTKIVQEDLPPIRRKISESNILDTSTIFGSLKNIYKTLSSSVPLAERGVPEGQEDFTIYSSSHNISSKRNSYSSNETLQQNNLDDYNGPSVCEPEEIIQTGPIYKKPNLRLSRSEGFYPTYVNNIENQPENIILCDSNVYEHKGISYSYEYDKFQSRFNQENNKPKSSTVYQMLLNDLNFLKRSERNLVETIKSDPPSEAKSNSKPNSANSSPSKGQTESKNSRKISSVSSGTDWSSDTETLSDLSEKPVSKHLQSPLRKRNSKANHYTIQNANIKMSDFDISIDLNSENQDKLNMSQIKPTTKNSLINRFLRNVTQRKMIEAKLLFNPKKEIINNFFKFYVKNAKPNETLTNELENEINEEIQSFLALNKNQTSQVHCDATNKNLKSVFRNSNEILKKRYKVFSAYNLEGESRPLIVFLTDTTFYICSISFDQTYCKEFVLPYTELSFIMIGPNHQTIYISNADKDMYFFIITKNADVTSDLIGQIEIAMRRDSEKPTLPYIKQLTMQDMHQLRYSIYQQTAATKDEDIYHYSIVNINNDLLSPSSTPLGPSREGFLMYRKARSDDRWEFGYFILKGGVLYTLISPTRRIPEKVTPLYGGACQGAHRTPPRPRPHTFELLTESNSFEFAASDEYETSDWLQCLIQTASSMQMHHFEELPQTRMCSLIVTTDHLITARECFQQNQSENNSEAFNCVRTLSYAAIADLIAFRLPLAAQSWCVLEFACREAHESSGDWIIYFSTNSELDKFLSTIEMLWSYNNSQGDAFPLSTIAETEVLIRQASANYKLLQEAWS